MVEQDPVQVDWDNVYRALSNGTRRRILQQLLEENGRMREGSIVDTLGQPSTVSADGGRSRGDADVEFETGERLHMHLTHVHLPQLANAGLVEWDRDDGFVSVTQLSTNLPVGLLSPAIVHVGAESETQKAGD